VAGQERRQETVEMRCPGCGRFLGEVSEYGRNVCADCGWEVQLRSPAARRKVGPA